MNFRKHFGRVRTYDGKKFVLVFVGRGFSAANQSAMNYKCKGFFVRIVESTTGSNGVVYAVYVREKRR